MRGTWACFSPVPALLEECQLRRGPRHAGATLCPVCDRDGLTADKLLAFFAVHKTLEPSELETFHNLSAAWVAVARARHVDQQQLADEYERSRNGEL